MRYLSELVSTFFMLLRVPSPLNIRWTPFGVQRTGNAIFGSFECGYSGHFFIGSSRVGENRRANINKIQICGHKGHKKRRTLANAA